MASNPDVEVLQSVAAVLRGSANGTCNGMQPADIRWNISSPSVKTFWQIIVSD